jgi:hypothetical protein
MAVVKEALEVSSRSPSPQPMTQHPDQAAEERAAAAREEARTNLLRHDLRKMCWLMGIHLDAKRLRLIDTTCSGELAVLIHYVVRFEHWPPAADAVPVSPKPETASPGADHA